MSQRQSGLTKEREGELQLPSHTGKARTKWPAQRGEIRRTKVRQLAGFDIAAEQFAKVDRPRPTIVGERAGIRSQAEGARRLVEFAVEGGSLRRAVWDADRRRFWRGGKHDRAGWDTRPGGGGPCSTTATALLIRGFDSLRAQWTRGES